MIKTKPAGHVKPGDTLIFESSVGSYRTSDTVTKINVDESTNEILLTFPPQFDKSLEGGKIEVVPSSTLLLNCNKQVKYRAAS